MVPKLFNRYSDSSNIDDLRFYNNRERRNFKYYGLLMALGFVFIVLQFVFLSIPRELIFIIGSIKGILDAIQYSDLTLFLKQTTLLFLLTYQYLLLIYLRVNKKREHRN